MNRLIPSEQELSDAVDEASRRIPTLTSWGIFCGDESSPVASGLSIFCWYDSKEDMLAFITRYPLLLNSDWNFEDEEWRERDSAISCTIVNTIKSIGDGTTSTECGLKIINDELKGIERLKWWGTFADLISGSDQFCQQVRLDFAHDKWMRSCFENQNQRTAAPVVKERIEESEMEDFIEYLSEYGF